MPRFSFLSCQLLRVPSASSIDLMFDPLSLYLFLSFLPNLHAEFLLLGQVLMGIQLGFLFDMGLTCAAVVAVEM